jgi:hypothetical protein
VIFWSCRNDRHVCIDWRPVADKENTSARHWFSLFQERWIARPINDTFYHNSYFFKFMARVITVWNMKYCLFSMNIDYMMTNTNWNCQLHLVLEKKKGILGGRLSNFESRSSAQWRRPSWTPSMASPSASSATTTCTDFPSILCQSLLLLRSVCIYTCFILQEHVIFIWKSKPFYPPVCTFMPNKFNLHAS